ncbi:hypothetical protein ACFQE7_27225 [Nonomuraea ferruginea]
MRHIVSAQPTSARAAAQAKDEAKAEERRAPPLEDHRRRTPR